MGSLAFYEGPEFFLLLGLILIPAVVLGIREKPLRWYQTAASLFMAVLILGQKPLEFAELVLYFIYSYLLLKAYLLIRQKYGRKESWYRVVLLAGLLPIVFSKIGPLCGTSLIGFTGISYLTFRNIQMVIEIYDGVIAKVPLGEYTGFILFFPSISSGPIDRSRRFSADWNKIYEKNEYLELCMDGVYRILLGLVYKMILAAPFYQGMQFCSRNTDFLSNAGYAYCYGLYLFFDFAGYSFMAVGTAYILGIRLPDNFRRPFVSIDIRDFWDRWHISLSHWFRDFLFTRFIMQCSRKKWFHTRLQRACAGFLVNMGVMGLWHGLTTSYIIYGLYHGVLLAGTEVYQKKSGFYKKYKTAKWYRGLSWFVTMQAVFFGFFIFSGRFLEVIFG